MYCFCYEKVRVIWTSFLDSKLTLKKKPDSGTKQSMNNLQPCVS